MQDIYQAGVRDILISIQGLKSTHDRILGHEGAFDHILEVINWMQHLDMRIRINTVVSNNLNDLLPLWNILKADIHIWNLLPLNHWGDANTLKRMPYQEAGMMFSTLFRNRSSTDPVINLRYFPICFIENAFQNSVLNYYQHYSDETDWHPFFMSDKDLNATRLSAYKNKSIKYYRNDLLNKRKRFFVKDSDCLKCDLFNICDGYKK